MRNLNVNHCVTHVNSTTRATGIQHPITGAREAAKHMPDNTCRTHPESRSRTGRTARTWLLPAALLLALLPGLAQASIFQGETLDKVADVAAWVVLFLAPTIAIGVFWIVHILPEKIAEKRHHPQAKAIQTLCLLSLFFGGMLWPLAWLWAYSKPVLYKMAYGTDTAQHSEDINAAESEILSREAEIQQLRQRLVELEAQQPASPASPDSGPQGA
jgi:hypothetical protein